MRRHIISAYGGIFAPAAALAVGLISAPTVYAADTESAKSDDATPQSLVERGEYLVSTSGCNDCHTPWIMGAQGPEPDMNRMLSGHPESLEMPPVPALPESPWLVIWSATNTAIAGPWGVSFTRNLTPDEETGLGEWTLDDFVATIRTGRRTGRGREILPPMPIQAYNNFTDEDLEAIYSYLQTIPAISNQVPEPWDPVMDAETAQK